MEQLRQIPLFKDFPDLLMEQIALCTCTKIYEQGEFILRQGDLNNCLFFLKNGEIGVYVDEGLVARLREKGDLIGEMSLLSQQKCSATIKAESTVTMYVINAEELHKKIENSEYRAEFNMYRIYADILAQKLGDTNQKAKKVEALHEELVTAHQRLEKINASLEEKVKERTKALQASNDDLTQKNTELAAGHEKLKDLYTNRDRILMSMEELLNNHLKPLASLLDKKTGPEAITALNGDQFEKELAASIQLLQPLTNSFDAEKSMKNKRVLLAESVRKQQVVAKMALGGTGVELDIVSNLEEGVEKLEKNSYDIVLFDQANLKVAEMAREKNAHAKIVFVTSDEIANYVPLLLEQSFFPNVVSRDESDRNFTIKNFVTTISKMATDNIFGLEKYVSWGVKVIEHKVRHSNERKQLAEEMIAYFRQAGIRSSNCHRCESVVEELLMNAIYDAPRDKDGAPLYNHLDRTQAVELAPEHHARFRYATDGMTLAISVSDQSGALDAETVFRYLERCFTGGDSLNDSDDKKGGGGRGLHQILVHSDLVVFNIEPNAMTEVIAIFNADQKQAEDRNPNLHFFTK